MLFECLPTVQKCHYYSCLYCDLQCDGFQVGTLSFQITVIIITSRFHLLLYYQWNCTNHLWGRILVHEHLSCKNKIHLVQVYRNLILEPRETHCSVFIFTCQVGLAMTWTVLPFWDTFSNVPHDMPCQIHTTLPKSQVPLYILGYTRTSQLLEQVKSYILYILGYTRTSQLLEQVKSSRPMCQVSLYILRYTIGHPSH